MTIHSPLRHHPAPPRNRSSRPALPPPADRAALRQAWHLSERQVADAFGVTAATVRSWEAGRTSPTGRRRAAYAAFLGGLASGLASGLNGPPAQVPRAATGDRPRQRRSDPLHHSAAAEPPGPVPAQRVARRAAELKGLPVGDGFDPVSPERKRRLRLTAAAVGLWTVALHLVLTMPAPPL
ncbi:helix-turn-helix domain-containing protein [Streptomyces sp. NBC_00691]|uniref:helix-turn-helix domain-containing protein n=1 Tax=Streptomyces sp. NBC_00691 TaxID=2903671 RepID=UPI003FA7BAFE